MKIDRPWSIQIELTEGCNRQCLFCGTSGMTGGINHMTLETAEIIAQQCAEYIPDRRYEFAMHGEPTLNPNHVTILRMFREKLPKAQIQLTTNGYSILRTNGECIPELLSIVDFIVLDTYYPERDTLRKLVAESGYKTYENCSVSPYANHHRKIKGIFLMDDLGIVSGVKKNRVIFNHAGNAINQPVPNKPLEKKCTNVFREISVCYDGDVCGCCMDYGHEYVVGNIHKINLKGIWNSEEFEALRIALYNKERGFSPCNRCNYPGGMRQGLLEPKKELTSQEINVINTTIKKSLTSKRNLLETVYKEY